MKFNSALVLGASLTGLLVVVPAAGNGPQTLQEQAEIALGISASELGSVSLDVAVDGGQSFSMTLNSHSVRAPGFEVRVQDADGWSTQEPGPVTTYRGTVNGAPGSAVAASLLEDGLHARIFTDQGEFFVEPLANHLHAPTELHVLYSVDDVIPTGHSCGADLISHPGHAPLDDQQQGGGAFLGGGVTTAEIGCDADYEYYADYGSVGATTNRIEWVINAVNIQYERDVDITHVITTTLVRTSSQSQPYTRKKASQLLNQFRSEWNSNQSSVNRDIAHLFTGKSIIGGTIGIAWLGVVCNNNYGYGLVQSDFNNNDSSASDLSAHELGHNWNADHCSCTNYTMNPYITSANVFNPSGTIPAITSFRDSQSCFGPVDPPQDPTSIEVSSIAPGTQNAGQGQKYGTASVSISNDQGGAEAGATVAGTFSGDYNESVVGTTDGSGNVTFVTSTTQKGGINFTFCVTSVSGSLPYISANNAETCDSY